VTAEVQILQYRKEHQPWFEKLNRTWIEQYFEMEKIDFEVLQDPYTHIIAKGGSILMAQYEKEIAGTVALKYSKPGVFEFTKMAVDEKHRGKKIGLVLAQAAIRHVKKMGGHTIILYSNTVLEPAIRLYTKLGFKEVPVDGPYKRSNIKMELRLSAL
jgi:ribosomal protein S18 acetylase RimI-like enzyme